MSEQEDEDEVVLAPLPKFHIGRPPKFPVPTQADRDTVAVMVAAGISQADIARARGMSIKTLCKYYGEELAAGKTRIDTVVVVEHIKAVKRGDFPAIKWWEQSRMGWRGDTNDPDNQAPPSMKVVIEYVGDPATKPTIDHAPLRPDKDDDRDALRKNVQLIG